jgi:predicted nucleic acid-binding Zn ribbon protein
MEIPPYMFFLCKGNYMTELEAMNMLLRLIGSSPVNDIENSHPDVANARTTLDRIRKQAQRRGWWFNIDYGVTYQPNEINEIVLADEVTTLVAGNRDYVQRGRKLYDKRCNTYKFTTDVVIERQVRYIEWDDMPDSMQMYCAYFAGAEFVRDELEDPQKQQDLQKSAGMAMLDVKKQDLEEGRYNIFANARIARARGGVRPYGRGTMRFFGSPDV